MKKLVAMMALGMLVAGSAYAQETSQKEKKQRTEHRAKKGTRIQKADTEARATKQTEMMAKRLELSDAQEKELQVLNMRRTQELQALKVKYDKSDARNEAQRAERKAIQERWHADMKEVLNEKQYAQYKADRKKKRGKFEKVDKAKGQKISKEKRQKRNS